VTDVFIAIESYASRILLAGIVMLVLELALPASRSSLVSRIRGAWFWLVYIVISATAMTLFAKLWGWIGVPPAARLALQAPFHSEYQAVRWAGVIIAPISAGIISDFFYYWFHRLQHTSPFLWRFHAVHHSIEEMSGINSNHHFTEEIFRIPIVVIPLSLVVPVSGPVPWIVSTVMGMLGLYIHSCTRLHFGIARYVIADNRFHRIHHSIEPQHQDRNFGSLSSLWDTVFRTAHFPHKGEWPATGVKGVAEPTTVADFLWRPFTGLSITQRSGTRR
jgi:sterol desaturase/sphingolipid hydroxylase (fatty acid hydroxylase superfamily)